jgi:hypothetical protein
VPEQPECVADVLNDAIDHGASNREV